ncbi:MAG: condensation domain-containing protein, partial [Gemmatimonadota bacterium]
MNTVDLLRELRALGIRIRVEGDQLAVKAPAGALTPELAARLRDHKAEILAFLRDAEFAPGGESASESLKGLADPASPPVSPDQRKEWHLQRLDPESSVYNAAGAFRLRGPLDTSALRTAIQAMVDRHAVLRSRFPAVNGEPVLVIEDEVRVEIPETDLSAVPEEEREGAMRAFLEEAADEILDLERGPPFLARLARLGPEDHAFFFMAHSVVWDGWCFDLLLREMTAHYEACLDGRSDALPPLPIQYPDYAAWQKLREERGDFKPHLDFWRRQLKGPIPHLGLPTDRPRKAESDYRGARVWSKVEKRILDGLRALARAEGATLYMVLLASLDVLLHRYTGRADFLVSSPLQGRTHPELEDLLGAFTNTLFFRARVESGESFRTLLRNVKETCLEAVQHQEAPSDQVIQIMDEQGLGRAPYEVIFVFQQTAARPTRMGPVSVHSISRGTRSVPVDLLMWAREYDDYMDGGFDYRTSLFDEERME